MDEHQIRSGSETISSKAQSNYPESAVLSNYLFLVPVDVGHCTFKNLLFSPLSGTLDFLDDKAARRVQQLRTEQRTSMDSQIDRELWDRGYLFEDRDAELRQSKTLYYELLKFHRDLQRHQIAIIPTYSCNLDCVYCWQDRQALPSKVMDADTVVRAFQAADQLVKGVDPGQIDICLFGGEPLQARGRIPEAIEHIIEESERRGFSLKAITNGVDLFEYLPLFAGRLKLVQITLDGPEEVHERRRRGEHGTFRKIVAGIDQALKEGVRVNIRVNVARENLKAIPELTEFVENRWGKHGPALYLSPVKGEDANLPRCNEATSLTDLLSLFKSEGVPENVSLAGYRAFKYVTHLLEQDETPLHRFFRCEAQLNFWALDPVGNVYVCFDACGNPQLSVGRFLPVLEIEKKSLEMWRSHSSLNNRRCIACAAAPNCSGGCAFVEASQLKGSCDRLMDSYPIALAHHAKAIYELAVRESRTVGFICS
jgi:uncharacterized protein